MPTSKGPSGKACFGSLAAPFLLQVEAGFHQLGADNVFSHQRIKCVISCSQVTCCCSMTRFRISIRWWIPQPRHLLWSNIFFSLKTLKTFGIRKELDSFLLNHYSSRVWLSHQILDPRLSTDDTCGGAAEIVVRMISGESTNVFVKKFSVLLLQCEAFVDVLFRAIFISVH